MTNDTLDQLEAMASKIVLRDGDEEMAVVPVLVAEIKRLREELRDTHTKVFHLEEKLAWMERERDQLTSLPAERILARVRALHFVEPVYQQWCHECNAVMPCPTLRALDGDA